MREGDPVDFLTFWQSGLGSPWPCREDPESFWTIPSGMARDRGRPQDSVLAARFNGSPPARMAWRQDNVIRSNDGEESGGDSYRESVDRSHRIAENWN